MKSACKEEIMLFLHKLLSMLWNIWERLALSRENASCQRWDGESGKNVFGSLLQYLRWHLLKNCIISLIRAHRQNFTKLDSPSLLPQIDLMSKFDDDFKSRKSKFRVWLWCVGGPKHISCVPRIKILFSSKCTNSYYYCTGGQDGPPKGPPCKEHGMSFSIRSTSIWRKWLEQFWF